MPERYGRDSTEKMRRLEKVLRLTVPGRTAGSLVFGKLGGQDRGWGKFVSWAS